jgi:transglutaminase-like putative cysteine protease
VSQRLTVAAAVAAIAASLSLYPLVSGWLWFWEGAGAIAVVAVAGALTRLRVLPWPLCAPIGLIALLLYVNVLFSSAHSLGRIIPTAASLHHLWSLARQGLDGTARFAPPAPAIGGILLLTVLGIGVAAVATDLLAVRLRRPAVAGLPLLVLFCVPLTTTAHEGVFGAMLVFGVGMAGYLAMLAVDARDRLRLWGRLVTMWHRGQDPAVAQRGTPNTRELAAAGRRIGVAAVVIAVFVPLLVPGLRNHKLFSGGGGGGGELVALPKPVVQMNADLRLPQPRHVLTYRTADPDPQYLQVYVLNNLTSSTWTMAPAAGQDVHDGKLSATPGLSRSTTTSAESTRITLGKSLTTEPRTASFLPLPYPASSVNVSGDWRSDPRTLTMFSAQHLAGLSYTVTSREVSPTQRQLEQSGIIPNRIETSYLDVPQAFSPLSKLALRITRNQTTPYGKAVALQRWFAQSGNFTYSLNVREPNTAKALINFLTKDRQGYCQQFAFAMAVLARLLNIPSRVAVGYTEGSPIGHDRWDVRTSDAHAWPELYFQGAGWLRFEPTPSGAGGQATAHLPAYTLPLLPSIPGGAQGVATPAATVPQTGATPGNSGALAKLNRLGATGAQGGASGAHSSSIWLIVVAVIAVLLVTPRLARSLTRRRRWSRAAGDDRERAQAAWLELLDDLTDYQVGWSASESPRALGTRLTGTVRPSPEAAAALTRIVHATERARYARDPADSATLRADTDLVRGEVAARAGRLGRWRAWLLPPSSLRPARAAVQHGLDVFGWMDVAAHRTGAWSRRGPRADRKARAA